MGEIPVRKIALSGEILLLCSLVPGAAVKRNGHVAHRSEIVNLAGLHLLDDADQIGGVGQIAVVQFKLYIVDMRILIKVIDAVCIEQGRAAFNAMYDVAFFQ